MTSFLNMRRRAPHAEANALGFDQLQAGARAGPARFDDADCVYRFQVKHRWSLKNNPLCGLTLPQWLAMLWRHGRSIELCGPYALRVLSVSALALVNSVLALVEHVLHSRAIARTQLHPEPIFILGHPRTGTTLLHNLLSEDSERFATCSTFCAGFP